MEYRNARRFHPNLLVSQGLGKKAADAKKRAVGLKGKGAKTPITVTPTGSSGDTRGGRSMVRFEVGRSPGEGGSRDEDGSVEGEAEAVQGLLRRMWEHHVEDGAVGED